MTTPRSGRPARDRARWMVAVWFLAVAALPLEAEASVECETGCVAVFGLTSFTVATGTAVGWGRVTGGLSTQSLGKSIWATSFGLSLGAGFARWGAPSHERMIYSAGVGSAAGALLGVALESAFGRGEGSDRVAAALMGAAVGAVAGGVYGVISHEEDSGAELLQRTRPPPVIEIRIPF